MKITKTVTDPAKEREHTVAIVCDMCRERHDDGREWNDYVVWTTYDYDVSETQVTWTNGYRYPEGGSGEKMFTHICPTCFKDKLVPWLQSQGCEVRTEEVDW